MAESAVYTEFKAKRAVFLDAVKKYNAIVKDCNSTNLTNRGNIIKGDMTTTLKAENDALKKFTLANSTQMERYQSSAYFDADCKTYETIQVEYHGDLVKCGA